MRRTIPTPKFYNLYLSAILFLALIFSFQSKVAAQTTIYSENFNTGTSTSWSLNAADAVLNPTTTTTKNYWAINNVYAGSSFVNATDDEPSQVIGYPESYYMHITDGGHTHFGITSPYNASFFAPVNGQTMLAKMNTAIVATGYTGVTLKFWYMCDGGSANYTGRLYYTIDGGATWVQKATYSGVGTWTQATVTDPAFDNAADLRFGFEWVQLGGSSAADPPMSVDDIFVTGTTTVSCPLTISNQSSTNPICHGANDGTITITATNGSGITYTINSGTPISNSTGIFTGLAPGTYTVSVADTCTKTGTNIILTDPAAVPAPVATNNGPICVGDTMKLFASTVSGASYAWTGPTAFNIQNPVKPNAGIGDAGTYSVIATVGVCHSAAATTTIVINALPATPTATNNGPLCAGDSLKLFANTIANATYSWTGPNSFNIQNPVKSNTLLTDSGNYQVVATVAGCHSLAGTTHVSINPTPATPVAGNNGPLCTGDSLKLTSSTVAGASYNWTGPNSYNIQNPTKLNVTLNDSGIYTLVATVGNCHSASVTTHVVISPPPAAPVATNNGPVCAGTLLQLNATGTGTTYTWTGPNNFSSQNPSVASASLSDAGTYSVVAHIGSCSSSAATTTVVVNPAPASPTASNTGPVCAGNPITLNATTVSNASYSWTGPNSYNVQNPTIAVTTVNDAGTYSVVAIVAGCSSAPATTTLVITPGPAAPVASNNGPLCLGDALHLFASTVANATYSWSGPHTYNNQNPSIANTVLTDSGTYTVIAMVAGCNSVGASTHVVIVAPPTAPVATNSGPVCSGTPLQLNATGNANYTYSWTGPNTFNIQNPNIASAALTDSGTYTVVASIGSCTSPPATTHVVINPTPVAPSVTNNGPVCVGDSFQLSSPTVSGATYSWTGPNNFNSQNPIVHNASGSDAGTYSLAVTVGNCTSSTSSSTTVVVNALPTPPTITASDSIICANDSVQLCVPANFTSYQWNSGPTTNCIYVRLAGNYYVTVSDGNGCSVESANHVPVAVRSVPQVSITQNGDTLICVTGVSCQWYLNNGIISGATSHVYIATVAGQYSVLVTDSNGCSARSSNVTVVAVGIAEIGSDMSFNVYPNPAADKLIVEMGNFSNAVSNEIEIFDIAGRKVQQSKVEGSKSELNVSHLTSGVYTIRIGEIVRKFIKE